MRFEWRNGLIWVSVAIVYGGRLVEINDCIVDTGSASTALDIDLLDFDYQKPTLVRRLVGIRGGIQEVLSQKVDSLIIDRQPIHDIDIEFGNIGNNLGINGFIGTNVLSRFKLTLDFVNQTMDLS